MWIHAVDQNKDSVKYSTDGTMDMLLQNTFTLAIPITITGLSKIAIKNGIIRIDVWWRKERGRKSESGSAVLKTELSESISLS